jgi:hypothetical protein
MRSYQTMNDQTQTGRTPTDLAQWHRWFAWHPVICDKATGGVAWLSIIWRRRIKRSQWNIALSR